MKFAIIDAANTFNRAYRAAQGDAFEKAGMAMHIFFKSLRKVHRKFDIDHMVICAEGRSWRYSIYPQYKANRVLKRQCATPKEQEEMAVMKEIGDDLLDFLKNQTRVTFLHNDRCEGDDFVGRWVDLHPNDEHVIVSADSDFVQLLAPNVTIYDGLMNRQITLDGVFDDQGERLIFNVDSSSGKIKVKGTLSEEEKKFTSAAKEAVRKARAVETEAKKNLDEKRKNSADASLLKTMEKALAKAQIETMKATQALEAGFHWEQEEDFHRKALFVKMIRGDVGDGIFSSSPRAPTKGSTKRVGINDAWDDRHEKKYAWNNFFLRTWDKLVETPEGPKSVSVTVKDEFAINEQLIDLTKQPADIRELMDSVIVEAVQRPVLGAGLAIRFGRFCAKHDLTNIGREVKDHTAYLGAPYAP